MLFVDIDQHRPAPEAIECVVSTIVSGGLIVCPTETRYGLVCQADNREAVKRLFSVKGRSSNTATALFVNNIHALEALAVLSAPARKLAQEFLPGPLTLVLKARVDWPAPLVVEGRIGIRVSQSPLIAALVERVGGPLTATSANRTGSSTRSTAHEIAEELGAEVDMYVEAGILDGPVSTVVDCSAGSVHILREGALPVEQIRRAIGEVID